MIEAKWLACADPWQMVRFLGDRLSERKMRLFGCACIRQYWELLQEPRCKEAVEIAEGYADHLLPRERLLAAYVRAKALAKHWVSTSMPENYLRSAVRDAVNPAINRTIASLLNTVRWAAVCDQRNGTWERECTVRTEAAGRQAQLLREIVGKATSPAPINSAWLVWHDSAVVRIAEGIQTDRRFENMPILADALEEAGCDKPDILQHCRSGGQHVRGCWVLDLLLGKE